MQCFASGDGEAKMLALQFLNSYLSNLHFEVAKNWLRIDGYFKLFCRLIEGSLENIELYRFFLAHNLIACFIDFMMEKASPIHLVAKRNSIGTKSSPVQFGDALAAIFLLLKQVFTFQYRVTV